MTEPDFTIADLQDIILFLSGNVPAAAHAAAIQPFLSIWETKPTGLVGFWPKPLDAVFSSVMLTRSKGLRSENRTPDGGVK